MSVKRVILLGLPSTGKTSFLAALWYAVHQTHVKTGLNLEKLEGDSKYLNQIRDAWLEYKPVPRNPLDSEMIVSMALKNRETGSSVRLTFPDLSGESFRLQWTKRQFTPGYDEFLRQSSGAILFLHPLAVTKPHRLETLHNLAAEISPGTGHEATEAQTTPPDSKPWDPEQAPTQVQVTELLQFMAGRDYFTPPLRLAVAVSAWDLLTQANQSPEEWVASQLPLLHQFIKSNSKLFEAAFYGVSAQGGKYDGAEMSDLQSKLPATRIQVVAPGVKDPHDITEPLQWLMH